MSHHLVSEQELKTFCIYCKAEVHLSEWKSEWHLKAHYKTLKCSCGKDLHMKMSFDGSGHDSWNGTAFKPVVVNAEESKCKGIEEMIKVVERTKIVERIYPKSK